MFHKLSVAWFSIERFLSFAANPAQSTLTQQILNDHLLCTMQSDKPERQKQVSILPLKKTIKRNNMYASIMIIHRRINEWGHLVQVEKLCFAFEMTWKTGKFPKTETGEGIFKKRKYCLWKYKALDYNREKKYFYFYFSSTHLRSISWGPEN